MAALHRWSVHGGRVTEAAAHYGGDPADWLDLSTGVSPVAWPGCATVEVDWTRLPEEAELSALEAAAAAHFGTRPAHVCALPGSEIGLRLLGRLLDGPARHVAPGYRTHGEMVADSLPLDPEDVARHAGGSLILANPSNPEGRRIDPATLRMVLDRIEPSFGWLVIDEAYADATPDISLAAHVGDDRRLIVFRSFGKFFGLPGVRLGFLLGPAAIIGQLRWMMGSWPLPAAALAIGTAAYRDRDWIAAQRVRLAAQAAALDAMLSRHGLAAREGTPFFRLVETPDAALFDRLARRAILTRPFDHDPRWLRIGLPGDARALERLEAALRHG